MGAHCAVAAEMIADRKDNIVSGSPYCMAESETRVYRHVPPVMAACAARWRCLADQGHRVLRLRARQP